MTNRFRYAALLLVALLAFGLFAFTACAREDEPATDGETPDVEDTATPEPQDETAGEDETGEEVAPAARGGGTVVNVVLSESPFMDPIRQNDAATADITHQMMEGLVRFTPYPYNEIEASLATDWRQLNPTTWEFDLRQGVYFHDGSYFTADAFVWSIARLLDPREAAPGAFILEMVEDVIAVDTYTVHLVLEFPFVPILGHLTHQVGFVMSPAALAEEVHARLADFEPFNVYDEDDEVVETVEEYVLSPWQEAAVAYAEGRGLTFDNPRMVTANPVGTGPFVFSNRVSGDYTVMVPNHDHWRVVPDFDYLIFRVIPDPVTRFAMMQAGEGNLFPASPADVMQIPMHPQITLVPVAGTGIDYIGFNMLEGPLADQRVRHALTLGLNAESVIMGAYEGIGTPAVGPIGPNVLYSPHYAIERMPFDPERAMELLEEAGFGDGLSLRFWVNEGNPGRLATAEIAQAYWAQIGVDITIEILEWGTYLTHTAEGLHDMFMLGWTTVTGDPDYGTFSLFTTENWGNPGNRTFYSNPRVDELLMEGRMSTDSARRAAIYHELTEILAYDAPWIFIRHPIQNWGTYGINGFAANFNHNPYFYGVTLAD